jgi:hypothetical protein
MSFLHSSLYAGARAHVKPGLEKLSETQKLIAAAPPRGAPSRAALAAPRRTPDGGDASASQGGGGMTHKPTLLGGGK